MSHPTPATLLTQMPTDPNKRPRYDSDQLRAYFHRINLPSRHLSSPVLGDPKLAGVKEHALPLLQALLLHHLASIPFENLELHYSSQKAVSLNMDDLYQKFVVRGMRYSRGGRCMESNGFFGTVLRSLGYDVRNCAGRVSRSRSVNAETREKQGDTYDGFNHMLNLVRIEEQWYVVDVGMGAMGPCVVLLLDEGETVAIPPRKIRLQRRAIPEHAAARGEEAPKMWCYDVLLSPDKGGEWSPTYCFTETEFLPQDYEMMSFYTSHNPRSFFTYSILCTRLLLDDAGEKVIGDITLFNDVVRKIVGGKKEILAELKTEGARIEALKDLLGVELTEEETRSISLARRLG
jgi:arylamine N-acetyltransferase